VAIGRAAGGVLLGSARLDFETYEAAVHGKARVALARGVRARMERHRDSLMRQLDAGARIYGVNTGYGADSGTSLAREDIQAIQRNTLRSHAVGTGPAVAAEIARGMLLLKARELVQGPSAVRPVVVDLIVGMLNHDIAPVVPEQGSLAASGDLVPNGHMGLALLGEGEVLVGGRRQAAAEALAAAGLQSLVPEAKEGLALVNGTGFTTAFALDNVRLGEHLLLAADVLASMTLQALKGFTSAYDPRIIGLRPFAGAAAVASNLRALCDGSELLRGPRSRVHDPYCLRCLPQIHGASRDAFAYVRSAVAIELGANTDNPLVFPSQGVLPGGDSWISGGNFHAQPVGIPMDTLTVAMAEIGSVSQRRIQHLVAPVYDVGLPERLSPQAHRSIGLSMLNTTAAAIVSESRTLCFPASVDSMAVDSTEDHVSMGSVAARKAHQVIRNTAQVLALELVCACQALDLHEAERPSPAAAAVRDLVRETVRFVDEDRPLYEEVRQLAARILEGEVGARAAPFLPGRG
jgi:histidine ammonia-lyase